MTKELQGKKGETDQPISSDRDAAPTSKQGRRKDVAPERASELQARQRAIGLELRRMFDDVAKEPVPQEFLELLQQIDRKRED